MSSEKVLHYSRQRYPRTCTSLPKSRLLITWRLTGRLVALDAYRVAPGSWEWWLSSSRVQKSLYREHPNLTQKKMGTSEWAPGEWGRRLSRNPGSAGPEAFGRSSSSFFHPIFGTSSGLRGGDEGRVGSGKLGMSCAHSM